MSDLKHVEHKARLEQTSAEQTAGANPMVQEQKDDGCKLN